MSNRRRLNVVFVAILTTFFLLFLLQRSEIETALWPGQLFGHDKSVNDTLANATRDCLSLIAKSNTVDYSWVCRWAEEPKFDPGWIQTRFSQEEKSKFSNAARWIYLEEEFQQRDVSKGLSILVWNHGKSVERRFLYSYGDKKTDPFGSQQCSVHNCVLTSNDTDIDKADAVIFHLHKTKTPEDLPKHRGNPGQVWIWMTDESPFHTFMAGKNKMADYNGMFNWSMSYRSDTDVPVPYGRTVSSRGHNDETAVKFATKTKLAAILQSNNGGHSGRNNVTQELSKHMVLDRWGGSSELKCAGHFRKDCPGIDVYKFYLAFENSRCSEYITEKMFWNAYHKWAVPIVLGGWNRTDYERLAPPHSFIQVEDFAEAKDLANFLTFLGENDAFYLQFHRWRKYFDVLNEHGYFVSDTRHICRVCEALNYNRAEEEKVYSDLDSFWSHKSDCKKV